jgi:2,3-bisphosphoglycerate-dependent phosphoglycerate mutase
VSAGAGVFIAGFPIESITSVSRFASARSAANAESAAMSSRVRVAGSSPPHPAKKITVASTALNLHFVTIRVSLRCLPYRSIHSVMKRLREFYSSTAIAALALVAACSAGQKSTQEPVPVEGSTTVYLVRHAEKVISNSSDPDPDISSLGRDRAKALASRLAASGVTAIFTTQFKRTQQTAAPLAEQIGVTPEILHVGSIGDTDSSAAAILRHRGGKVLVVQHSNTIAPLIEALGGPHLPNLCDNQYSNLFILYIPPSGQPELVRQHFGNSDPPFDPQCADRR